MTTVCQHVVRAGARIAQSHSIESKENKLVQRFNLI